VEKKTVLEIATAKELRGAIVQTLYTTYPTEVTIGTLRSLLRHRGTTVEEDIKKAVYYLRGKKYVKLELSSDYWDNIIFLTPEGINLAERDTNDIGVMIDG